FVSCGITYCNRSELSKIKSGIKRGDIDFKSVFVHSFLFTKVNAMTLPATSPAPIEKRTDSTPSGSFLDLNDNIRLKEPLFIDLRKDNCPFEKPLTQLEEALLIFTLLEEFPNFEINLKDGRTLFIIDDSAHKGLNEQNTKWIKNFNNDIIFNENEFTCRLLTEICGVSQIFYYLSKVKPPLIVHNSLLDLLHIYNSFEDNLPETYNEWKCAIHALFPVIIDTKVLATTLREELISGGCADLSLQALGAFLNSDLSSKILPVRTSLNIGTEGIKQFVKGTEWLTLKLTPGLHSLIIFVVSDTIFLFLIENQAK
ncbi:CAF1 family ribonuclease, partial [Necator americanus]